MLRRHPIVLFALLAYGFSWLAMLLFVLSRRGVLALQLPHWWEAVAAFGPFVAALMTLRLTATAADRAAFWSSLRRWRLAPVAGY
jgi:hypothetical protein